MNIAHVIGRFQPFHNGHMALLQHALDIADRVIIVLGDTGCAPDTRNPWSTAERESMIRQAFPAAGLKFKFVSVVDSPYNDYEWAEGVRDAVHQSESVERSFLVGFAKDANSFYLGMFPEWDLSAPPELSAQNMPPMINAADVRDALFRGRWHLIEGVVPAGVLQILKDMERDRYAGLRREYAAILRNRDDWDCPATKKYGGPIMTTADVLVECNDHILLVVRGGEIGCGTYALPGGFVNPDERLAAAALRELKEETGLTLPQLLRQSQSSIAFDHPSRSSLGRVVTHVFQYRIGGTKLPAVAGADDAAQAFWMHRSDIAGNRHRFFDDHFHIVDHFLHV